MKPYFCAHIEKATDCLPKVKVSFPCNLCNCLSQMKVSMLFSTFRGGIYLAKASESCSNS